MLPDRSRAWGSRVHLPALSIQSCHEPRFVCQRETCEIRAKAIRWLMEALKPELEVESCSNEAFPSEKQTSLG